MTLGARAGEGPAAGGESAPSPWLSSLLARLAISLLVGLSIYVGFDYWHSRHEEQLAWITVAAEIIAFCGLSFARQTWRKQGGWALVATTVTAIAASWCGMTMAEKISYDGRTSAISAAQSTLPYTTAANDLESASRALRAKLAAPQPACACPQTIASWNAAQAAAIERLENARDDAQRRLLQATPPVRVDPIAYARGAGVEIVKLFGFAAFACPAGARRAGKSFRLTNDRVGGGFLRRAATIAAATVGAMAPVGAHAIEAPAQVSAHAGGEAWRAEAWALRLGGITNTAEIARRVGRPRETVRRELLKTPVNP